MIFAYLSLDDVGNFALTSKRAKALAAGYLASRACLRRVLSLPSKMAEVSQCCLLFSSKCNQTLTILVIKFESDLKVTLPLKTINNRPHILRMSC